MTTGLRLKFAMAALLVAGALSAQSSLNTTLTDQLAMANGHTLANICGYTAPNGNEYALLGDEDGMIIVDVTNPNNVTQIVQIPMVNSLWKEIKVWRNYAYVTTEGNGGALQIVNLNAIPATTPGAYSYHTYTGDGAINGQLSTVHALHIDTTKGFCYLFGTNLFQGGAIFLDLNADPYNPTYAGNYAVGAGNAAYVHDGYVDNDTLYAGHIYVGYFTIVDCTNKSAPVEIGQQTTSTAFTHNTWISADRNYLFTTDENTNSFLTCYDISNPSNIQEMDRTQSWNPNSGSIVHNTHVVGQNWAVTSWYRDGFVITDITRPHNLINVGWYDTYNGSGNGFDGDWGVYPYFPSGTIVVSNINEGLFVFSPTYVRACYVEGNVYDSLCGTPLSGVTVTISSVNVTDQTDITGDYATGTPIPGTYNVTFSKPGYNTVTYNNVVFAPGQVNFINVGLFSPTGFALGGNVEDATTTVGLPNISVVVSNATNSYQFNSDVNGDFVNCAGIPGFYDVYAGTWGYQLICTQDSATPTSGPISLQLDSGYEDDFTLDFGWTVTGNASAGTWERGEPVGTTNMSTQSNPDFDVNGDCSDKCYVTGNGGGSASQDDVDNGNTVLTSPVMNLSTYGDPWVHYSRWFYNAGGSSTPNDSFCIRITNGITTVTLERVTATTPNNSSWVASSFRLSNYIAITSNMQMILETADQASSGHLVEAAFDNFFVVDSNPLAIHTVDAAVNSMLVYPNPFNGTTQVKYSVAQEQAGNATMEIVDLTGRVVASSVLENANGTVTVGESLADGVYMVRIIGSGEVLAQEKIVKAK